MKYIKHFEIDLPSQCNCLRDKFKIKRQLDTYFFSCSARFRLRVIISINMSTRAGFYSLPAAPVVFLRGTFCRSYLVREAAVIWVWFHLSLMISVIQ